MSKKVELICDYCGEAFLRYPSNIHNPKHMFCSKQCMNKYIEGAKEKRICKQCGKEFEVYKIAIEKTNASGNFCCRQCYNEYLTTLKGEKNKCYNRIIRKCGWCGKDVAVIPSKAREYEHSFCNIECRSKFMAEYMKGNKNPFWKGGTSNYRGNFEEVKKKYFVKNKFCAICGTTKNIHIHHIIPYRLTKDNSVGNLIPLCGSHHKVVEELTKKVLKDVEDYEKHKYLLNNILRSRQMATVSYIMDLKEKYARPKN